ncbi:MAG: DUF2905 domain-containing protein [Anaerolineales bacterium]|jgi:hypothetical protein
MFDINTIARWILLTGAVLLLVGAALWVIGRLDLPIGHLPGDIQFQRGNFSCFIPLASSIVISLLLTLILNLVIRFLNR